MLKWWAAENLSHTWKKINKYMSTDIRWSSTVAPVFSTPKPCQRWSPEVMCPHASRNSRASPEKEIRKPKTMRRQNSRGLWADAGRRNGSNMVWVRGVSWRHGERQSKTFHKHLHCKTWGKGDNKCKSSVLFWPSQRICDGRQSMSHMLNTCFTVVLTFFFYVNQIRLRLVT